MEGIGEDDPGVDPREGQQRGHPLAPSSSVTRRAAIQGGLAVMGL